MDMLRQFDMSYSCRGGLRQVLQSGPSGASGSSGFMGGHSADRDMGNNFSQMAAMFMHGMQMAMGGQGQHNMIDIFNEQASGSGSRRAVTLAALEDRASRQAMLPLPPLAPRMEEVESQTPPSTLRTPSFFEPPLAIAAPQQVPAHGAAAVAPVVAPDVVALTENLSGPAVSPLDEMLAMINERKAEKSSAGKAKAKAKAKPSAPEPVAAPKAVAKPKAAEPVAPPKASAGAVQKKEKAAAKAKAKAKPVPAAAAKATAKPKAAEPVAHPKASAAKATAKPKAAEPVAPPKAKASGEGTAKAKATAGIPGGDDFAPGLEGWLVLPDGSMIPLGCGKCRHRVNGCAQCKNPAFTGNRYNSKVPA